ncbi:hypothetical protein KJ766_01285 [Patescibacteria group bacterium]|nr:hypothetical protein [Patescibacteria group bacterium]
MQIAKMNERLNIQMDQITTTRRIQWRVVWIYLTVSIAILSAISLFHLLNNIDKTSDLIDAQVENVLHIKHKPSLYSAQYNDIISTPLIFGSAINIKTLLPELGGDFSVYLEDENVIAVSYSGKYSQNIANIANDTGLTYKNIGNVYIISKTNCNIQKHTAFKIKEIFSNTIGSLHENGRLYKIKLKTNTIIVKQKTDFGTKNTKMYDYNQLILAVPSNFETFLHGYIPNDLVELLNNHPGFVQLFLQNDKTTYKVTTDFLDLNNEQLDKLGYELISLKNLSTTALTIDGDTEVLEIISNTNTIDSNISVNENTTNIQLTVVNGESLKITKTPYNTIISNIQSLPEPSKEFKSIGIIKPGLLFSLFKFNDSISALKASILLKSNFQSVIITKQAVLFKL